MCNILLTFIILCVNIITSTTIEVNNMSFGANLKKSREQKGLTQAQLAELCELSPASIVAYEASGKTPSYDALMRISDILEVSLDWLCEKERPLKTLDEFARHIIKLSAFADGEYFRFDKNDSGTFYIVFSAYSKIFCLDENDCEIYKTIEEEDEIARLDGFDKREYNKNELAAFLCDFLNIKSLYLKKSIDNELLNMWLENSYDKIRSIKKVGIWE